MADFEDVVTQASGIYPEMDFSEHVWERLWYMGDWWTRKSLELTCNQLSFVDL